MKYLLLQKPVKTCVLPVLTLLIFVNTVQSQTWNGGGTDDNWSNDDNWIPSAPSNDGLAQIFFTGDTRLTPNADQPWSLAKIDFDSNAGSFFLNGSDLTVQSTGTGNYTWLENNSANLQTINNDITYSGLAVNFHIRATSGDIVINGNIDLGTARSWLGSGSNPSPTIITVNGDIAGTGPRSLDIGQRGMSVILSGNNTFTGDVLNQRAELILRSNNALGQAGVVEFARNNNPDSDTEADSGILVEGALTIDRTFLVGDNTNATPARAFMGGNTAHESEFTGDVTLGTHATRGRRLELVAVEGGQVIFSGNLLGNGTDNNDGITKTGAGTVILSGDSNTYKGTTLVKEGTFLFNGEFAATGGNFIVSGDATLGGAGKINRSVLVQENGVIAGGEGLTPASALSIDGDLFMGSGSIISLGLGADGASSTLHRTSGVWIFDNNQTISFLDLGAETGYYSGIITGLSEPVDVSGWAIANEGWEGTFSYNVGGIDFDLTVIPEPHTTGLIIGVALLCVGYVRLRLRSKRW